MNGPHIDREPDSSESDNSLDRAYGLMNERAHSVLDLSLRVLGRAFTRGVEVIILLAIEFAMLCVMGVTAMVIAQPGIMTGEGVARFWSAFFLLMIPGSIPAFLYGRSRWLTKPKQPRRAASRPNQTRQTTAPKPAKPGLGAGKKYYYGPVTNQYYDMATGETVKHDPSAHAKRSSKKPQHGEGAASQHEQNLDRGQPRNTDDS